jgi:Protein of unknown function (DUF3089)
LARKFLYFIAISIALVFGVFIALRLFSLELSQTAFVPTTAFEEQAAATPNAYADPAMWFVRPGLAENPAAWLPAELRPDAKPPGGPMAAQAAEPAPAPAAEALPPLPPAAIFFVHPTSYMDRAKWNAPLDDRDANHRTDIYLRGLASAFNAAGQIWAPRYRQATLGAFLADDRITAGKAIDAAYLDVERAFDQMLKEIPKDQPILLVGHSQGALHLTRLLKDRIARQPLAKRIAAAYVIGWPVSVDTDLAALGLPACTAPDQPGCILSWVSFAEPADPEFVMKAYDASVGFDGRPRRNTRMLCTNPLTGTVDATAEATANLGTLKPDSEFKAADLLVGAVPARCDDTLGLLLIGEPIDLGRYVLPGNNYHVYDIPLFWMNVRADVERRLRTFAALPS